MRAIQSANADSRIQPEPNQSSRAVFLAVGGLIALAAGAIVYFSGRPAGSAYLFPEAFTTAQDAGPIFGSVGGVLPGFVHVLGFSLLTVAALRPRTRFGIAAVALGWFMTDVLFGIGQHEAVAPSIAGAIPTFFSEFPLLENIAPYFLRGTFDVWDIAAYAAGALAAVVFATCCEEQRSVS